MEAKEREAPCPPLHPFPRYLGSGSQEPRIPGSLPKGLCLQEPARAPFLVPGSTRA